MTQNIAEIPVNYTPLPSAPSRLGRPTQFVKESTIFLACLPLFRQELNAIAAKTNALTLNPYSYGFLTEPVNLPPVYEFIPDELEDGMDNPTLVATIDQQGLELEEYNQLGTAGIEYLERLVELRGTIPFDPNKPIVQGVTVPPNKNENREDFNESAANFFESYSNHRTSFHKALWYSWLLAYRDEDYGKVTEEVTESTDFGRITDNTITI